MNNSPPLSCVSGRIVLSKGAKPWKVEDLKNTLNNMWKLQHHWTLTQIGYTYSHVALYDIKERPDFDIVFFHPFPLINVQFREVPLLGVSLSLMLRKVLLNKKALHPSLILDIFHRFVL